MDSNSSTLRSLLTLFAGIAAVVESLAYDVLEKTHCGWENSDGAYGDVIFDVADGVITLDYNERYTASENYTHAF